MNARFVPTCRLEDLILGEPMPGPHLERLWMAACPSDDGAVPVVLRDGPAFGQDPAQDAVVADDALVYVRERLALRHLLGGQGAPTVLRLVYDDRLSVAYPIGTVETHAGDLSVSALLKRNRELGGQLPVGVGLAIARGFAVAHAALERAAAGRLMALHPRDTFIDDHGVVRTLGEPHPTWQSFHVVALEQRRSVSYLSPEEIAGRPFDGRSPMFSLGVVLYELVSGRHPFHDQPNVVQLLRDLMTTPLPPLAGRRSDVPVAVLALIDRLTRQGRDDRYPSWRDAVAAIDDAIDRSERPTDAGLAAFCAGLCPEEMALARDRREEVALVRAADLELPVHPHRRLGPVPHSWAVAPNAGA